MMKVSKEVLKRMILNTEPDLTKGMVDRYSNTELKEWAKFLKVSL